MSEERVRVLLVDDEASLRIPLKRHLESNYGFQVSAAADCAGAMHLAKENQGQFDVALIDEVLQLDAESPSDKTDGIHLMQQLKARYPDVETIIFTGWGRESRQRAIQAGAFRYVEKPFDHGELAMVIRLAAQQVRLRTISREILSEKDPDRVLHSIMVAACFLAVADDAAIVLLDQVNDRLRVHTRTPCEERRWRRHFTAGSLSREIIHRGQVVRVPDTGADPRVDPGVPRAGISAFLGLPIPGEAGNLGALYVYSRRPGSFEEWGTVAVLQTLAGQAGLAFANAQAFQQVDTHARYMDALVHAGQGLTQATRLEDQLALAWDFCREQLQTSTFFVALYDRRDRVLRFPLAYDGGGPIAVTDKPEGEEWGVSGHVIRTGAELVWGTGEQQRQQCQALGIAPLLVGRPSQSSIYLPLKAGEEVMGVISIQSYAPHAFTPALLDAFRALGSQLAVALDNVRLLNATQRTADQIAALNQVVLEIGDERDRLALLRKVIERAIALLGVTGGGVYLLNPTGEYLTLAASVSLPLDVEGRRIDTGEGLTGEVLRTESPQWISDYYGWPKRLPFLDDIQITTVAGAPIKVGDRILGTLVVHDTKQGGQFDDAEIRLLQQLANHAGLALQKASLVEKLQAIQAVSAIITSSLDVEEVLQRACQAAVELFEADHSGLVLFDRSLEWGTVAAEYPEHVRAVGERIPVKGVPAEEKLILHREPLVISDVGQAAADLGPVSEVFTRLDIRSIALVPIVYKDRVLGSLSLDAVGHGRDFRPEEVDLCPVFAAHVAVAVENARLFAELAEAKEWQEALIENAFDAVIAINQDKKITVFNRRAEEMLGWTAEEMAGKTVARLHADIRRAQELFELVNREGAVSDWEVELIDHEGDQIPGLLSSALIRDSQGTPTGQAGFIQDLRQSHLLEGRLRAMIQVNKAITETLNLDQVFKLVIESAMLAFPAADGGSLHLFDERRNVLRVQANTFGYSQGAIAASGFHVGEGIAGWVFQHNQPTVVDDVDQDPRHKPIDPSVVPRHASMICVPLRVRNEVIGTLSLDSMQATNAFQTKDLGLLSTFADQAAIAIDNARRMQEVEQMRRAAEAMSRALAPQEALEQIAESAAQVLQADSAAIWSYDEVRDKFIPEELAAIGIPADELERFRKEEPQPGRTAATVMAQVYVAVTDISSPQIAFLGDPTRKLLRRIGAQSFQGVVLKLGDDERLGVLYVNYNRRRTFDEDDEARLRTFASHATLALKNARLLAQMQRTREAAGVIAGVTAQEDLKQTLGTIARHTQQVLGSDVVTLYSYDETTGQFGAWATEILKARRADSILPPEKLKGGSVIWNILALTKPPYYCLAEDHAIRDQRLGGYFVRGEHIRAAIGIQLRVGERKVGVMFVNFRSAHRFTSDELNTIQLFADQAAVAIRNAQLYTETIRQCEDLRKTRGLVGARTALAWMGMASSTWRHAIDKHALTIREQVQLLGRDWQSIPSVPRDSKIPDRIETIERLATLILERPITAPLSSEEGVDSVPLNSLVEERAQQLWQNDPYRKATLRTDFCLADEATVRASPEWLRRAFDFLVDNAVKALTGRTHGQVTIGTRPTDGGAEIQVSDTGPGIPEEIRAKIGLDAIERPEDATGLGMGLLMAQTIVQTYSGEIRCATSGATGTTMVIWLPLEERAS